MNNKIKIELVNWEKYNPRKDLKTMSWFRVENNLPEHSAFFELTNDGKWFFIWILCQAAKKNKELLIFDLNYAEHFSGVKKEQITEILQILHEHELIRYELVTNTNEFVPYERTNERTNGTELAPLFNSLLEQWNTFSKENKLAFIKEITTSRKEKLNKRIKENFNLETIFVAIKESSFLRGNNPKNWKVNFDWLIENDKNWLKVIEGNYKDKASDTTKRKISMELS